MEAAKETKFGMKVT